MTSFKLWHKFAMAGISALILTGCGTQAATPKSSPSKSVSPAASSSVSPSSSPSQSPSPSPGPSSSSPSITPSTSSSPTTSQTAPVPPGAGPYTDLSIHVVNVTPEGKASSSGTPLSLYLIKLSVYNPTSSLVSLALNDFTVVTAGSTAYSWNDYVTTGITGTTSFFPFPIHASVPGSDTVNIFPDQTHTGYVTIQVPAADHYDLIWNTGATTPVPEATFTP
ncbi:MAG: hypothetical protein C7B46_05690 [Sulfobacillus benefaciens]|uniref:DUF4352 domain-containing protein n=1 Tax=Sulfobacillus benefaciens TaxID=453960 RepID=A0A2T2XIZ9_9FIRM|nr:MAG: hypothetical protein C7B46_05690 [Sulfobacillus benefaciens]